MYVCGGIGADGEAAPAVPLVSQIFPFRQTSSFDFVGNNAQAILVKQSPSLANLRMTFTVEAVFYARSFATTPPYSPILVKSDMGLKSGEHTSALLSPA